MDKAEAQAKIVAARKLIGKSLADGSTPTPTQEENDLMAMGVSPWPLKEDGSPAEGPTANPEPLSGGGTTEPTTP